MQNYARRFFISKNKLLGLLDTFFGKQSERIRKLFAIEEMAWLLPPPERFQLRQPKAPPIIDILIDQITKRLAEGIVLPKSKFKKALGYFCSLIPHLKNYTQHASARLDNNPPHMRLHKSF